MLKLLIYNFITKGVDVLEIIPLYLNAMDILVNMNTAIYEKGILIANSKQRTSTQATRNA